MKKRKLTKRGKVFLERVGIILFLVWYTYLMVCCFDVAAAPIGQIGSWNILSAAEKIIYHI